MLKQFYVLFYSFDIMQTRQLPLYSEVYYCILNYVVIMKFKKIANTICWKNFIIDQGSLTAQ